MQHAVRKIAGFARTRQSICAAVLALAGVSPCPVIAADPAPHNVLFVCIDDLRPQLSCYGAPGIHSPNIDALAAQGLTFTRAYCQEAICHPSRTSVLTGLRPDSTGIHGFTHTFRHRLPEHKTLPQLFREHGYETFSLGKIFHSPHLDDKPSWSRPPFYTHNAKTYFAVMTPEDRQRYRSDQEEQNRLHIQGPAWYAPDVRDDQLPDGQIAGKALAILEEVEDGTWHGKPFFLAVGFHKPHLPFFAPKRYYDLYDPASIVIPSNRYPPRGAPPYAATHWDWLRKFWDMPREGLMPEDKSRQLILAYNACTSYVDAQVGRLLNMLKQKDLLKNTLILLWGDHGWQLDEHGFWGKHTNYELAVRAPMIIAVPNQEPRGGQTRALVELVDIYPSLCDLCGLEMPDNLEGTSFAPLISRPNRPWKTAVFSQYPRAGKMGYTIKTDRYRYTEWAKLDGHRTGPAEHAEATELYDHKRDPDENTNIAALPENRQLVHRLHQQLHAGWQAARPRK